MPLTTAFDHVLTTLLPLPTPQEGQTPDALTSHGMEVALELLHNPDVMIKHDSTHLLFEPLHPTDDQAVNVRELASRFNVALDPADPLMDASSEWKHYEITEHIPIMLGMSKQIVFQTAIRNNDDGMEAVTNPGSSVTIHGKYTIKPSDKHDRCLELSEFTTTRCSVLLGWYIKATMGKSHSNVHGYFKEQFAERMRVKS